MRWLRARVCLPPPLLLPHLSNLELHTIHLSLPFHFSIYFDYFEDIFLFLAFQSSLVGFALLVMSPLL